MIKKIVVFGSREYTNYDVAKKHIEMGIADMRKSHTLIFVCGGCRGADKLGERFAQENNFNIEYFLADWRRYGKAAGPKRNEEMAHTGDFFICFWDGKSKGTKDMIENIEKNSKPIKIIRI